MICSLHCRGNKFLRTGLNVWSGKNLQTPAESFLSAVQAVLLDFIEHWVKGLCLSFQSLLSLSLGWDGDVRVSVLPSLLLLCTAMCLWLLSCTGESRDSQASSLCPSSLKNKDLGWFWISLVPHFSPSCFSFGAVLQIDLERALGSTDCHNFVTEVSWLYFGHGTGRFLCEDGGTWVGDWWDGSGQFICVPTERCFPSEVPGQNAISPFLPLPLLPPSLSLPAQGEVLPVACRFRT